MLLKKIYKTLCRKKVIFEETELITELKRLLTTFDLIAIGTGSTLGIGAYVLAGEVAKTVAGPGIILSFIIGAFASLLAGLCYAEFGTRVPKAGQAYTYAYVTVGEFIAFIIGWDSFLEYSIGAASVAKGLSSYLDSQFEHTMSNFFLKYVPMHGEFISKYLDLFAFLIVIVFTIALSLGIKVSAIIGEFFTLSNIIIIVFIIIAGFFHCNLDNWRIKPEDLPKEEDFGVGGFLPYGFSGVLKGAAICFYGYIGLDVISAAGEETKNPKKSIPIAIITSLVLILLAYLGLSTVLTLMVPYYAEEVNAPFPNAFKIHDWIFAQYIVTFGAALGLFASLMGAMLPLPRVLYAMAQDGILFPLFGEVHPKLQTPVWGTLMAGLITAIVASIFNLAQLVSMLSIGTLLAYSIVAACALLLRYECPPDAELPSEDKSKFNIPNKRSAAIVTITTVIYCVWCLCLTICLTIFIDSVKEGDPWIVFISGGFFLLMTISMVIINMQPQAKIKLAFRTPWVPWLPCLSIFLNIYMMMELDYMTWIRFGIWLGIGLIIYFSYGIRHSKHKISSLEGIVI